MGTFLKISRLTIACIMSKLSSSIENWFSCFLFWTKRGVFLFYGRSRFWLFILFYSLLERAKRRHIPHRHEINGFGEGKKILNSIALNKEDQKKRWTSEDFARDGNKTWFFNNFSSNVYLCNSFRSFSFLCCIFSRFDIKAHCLISHLPLTLLTRSRAANRNNLIISAQNEGRKSK